MSTKPDFSDTIFRAFVARREILRVGRGRGRDSHHRFALLVRRDGVARVREPFAAPAHVDRSRGPRRRARVPREPRRAAARRPRRHHADRGAAPPDAPASSPRISASPTAPSPATSAISSSSVPVRPGSRRRCTARRKDSRRSSLDAVGVGGQAGASSRIENYVGFPNGVSGDDLVANAAIQAMRLGARLNAPCDVAGLRRRRGLPRRGARRRQRDPGACGDRRVGRALPAARRRRPRTLRRRRRVLRRDRSRSARVPRLRRGRRRWRQLRGSGRDLHGADRAARCRSSCAAASSRRRCRST